MYVTFIILLVSTLVDICSWSLQFRHTIPLTVIVDLLFCRCCWYGYRLHYQVSIRAFSTVCLFLVNYHVGFHYLYREAMSSNSAGSHKDVLHSYTLFTAVLPTAMPAHRKTNVYNLLIFAIALTGRLPGCPESASRSGSCDSLGDTRTFSKNRLLSRKNLILFPPWPKHPLQNWKSRTTITDDISSFG